MAMILAFAGSNSSTSINYRLIQYTVSLVKGHKTQTLDMVRYPFPMYSEDYEKVNGFSNSLVELKNDIKSVDGAIVSVNEHNGNPSAYFKNLLDWLSRVDKNFLEGKKVFLQSTSNGKRGAKNALEVTEKLLPRFGGEVVATFSLPSFSDNLDEEKGIVDEKLAREHQEKLNLFLSKL
ncbi:NADPH-dependent FMN reductase [Costertonia aggregata]|uniref:NAD(P)H-dependent oxidoreductase n=1 Tax=Costertonia aggregata TaxID=343403 RepID=A0A7H9AUE7_9FLAO|nr:NAD(P)H-dependent oxidoreductase [Costertonia aggregata]QLG46815.1 NAD(P)H-dependent oxidoreductase [Costertonia aggregata]